MGNTNQCRKFENKGGTESAEKQTVNRTFFVQMELQLFFCCNNNTKFVLKFKHFEEVSGLEVKRVTIILCSMYLHIAFSSPSALKACFTHFIIADVIELWFSSRFPKAVPTLANLLIVPLSNILH